MAIFFITNKESLYTKAKENLSNTDFKISFDYKTEEGIYALATHKLTIDNKNYAVKDNNFCIAVGTCIYSESLNYSSLLSDYNNNIDVIRENTIGQYGVCIKKDSNISFFGDRCGCFNIYYWIGEDGTWIVSSSLFHMVKILKTNLTFNSFSIAERAFYKVLLNGRTFFEEIHRLRGTEILQCDLKKGNTIEIQHVDVAFPVGSFDEMVEKTVEAYKKNAQIVSKVLGTPRICATGGLDSRILLASFLSVGVKPNLFYGKGNNIITAPKKEDLIILKKINKKLKLEFELDDFSVSNPLDKDWNHYIMNNGFRSAYMWGAQRNVINSLCKGEKLLMFGWGGEYLRRSWYNIYYSPSPSLDSMLSKWHNDYRFRGLANDFPEYKETIKNHFVEECNYLGINPNNLSEDDIYLLEIAWGAQADTQIPSFLQQYKYCYLMSFEYNIQRNRVTASEREAAKFMLTVLYRLYPKLLKEPIFTHEQWVTLDKKKMSLIPYKTSFMKKCGYKGKRLIRKLTPNFIISDLWYPIKNKMTNKYHENIDTYRPPFELDKIDRLEHINHMMNIKNIYRDSDRAQYAILCRTLKLLGY